MTTFGDIKKVTKGYCRKRRNYFFNCNYALNTPIKIIHVINKKKSEKQVHKSKTRLTWLFLACVILSEMQYCGCSLFNCPSGSAEAKDHVQFSEIPLFHIALTIQHQI